ncbi:MAG: hypothetical protein JW963_22880 [Anaerolineales bacterium]|nr:hypothetical protein [Anaerolineales bacterium]
MTKEAGSGKFLVSINDNHKHGHNEDIRFALKSTNSPEKFKVYKDSQKTPETFLQLALEEILTSELVLIDAIWDEEETYKDRLIQFGIAFALEKQRYFFNIKENSSRKQKIKSNYVDQFIIESPGYYSFIELLNEKIDSLSVQAQVKPRKPTDIIHEAFSVIGVNESTDPDLAKTIREFATEKNWHAAFFKPPSGVNIHEELSRQVGARTFSLFCVNKAADISVYIAIGLALGFGVPLLIIIEEEMAIPQILSGYAGIVSYTETNKTELKNTLAECTNIFFSPEIFKTWDGFTYFYLLTKTEKKLNESTSKLDIEEIEKIILAITNVGRAPIVQAYVLLGDVYRRKNQIIDPMNIDYLKQAISWYEMALNIQEDNNRCVDGIEATKKLIQLINLIKDKNYDSIPELIYLIGSGINSEQYQYLRSFLIGVVKKLLANKEYLPAIALLAAMQKHDKSDDLNKLWEDVNPKNFLESIQIYQQSEIKTKAELKLALEEINNRTNQLSMANKAIEQAKQLQLKLDHTTNFYGQNMFVNFGVGWASYTPLKGLPYVIRNNEKLLAKETMPILLGDTVYDGNDQYKFHWLTEYENELLQYQKRLNT